MRTSPSIAPPGPEQDTYLVLEDFGQLGRAWRETDESATDRQTLLRDLVEGEFSNPVRIVAFNIAEGWCRDVTVDIADELRCRVVEYGEYRSRPSNLCKPTSVELPMKSSSASAFTCAVATRRGCQPVTPVSDRRQSAPSPSASQDRVRQIWQPQ